MPEKEFSCTQCNSPEGRCSCTKYCTLCGNLEGTRLVEDGYYYCGECREACDYKTQDEMS